MIIRVHIKHASNEKNNEMKRKTMMREKKAYMRTIEVMIAVMLALFFLTYLTHQKPIAQSNAKLDLTALSSDDNFRNCALLENYTCLNEIVSSKIPKTYGYAINDSQLYYPDINKNVFVESFLISGSISEYEPVKVRVFYWKK